MRDRIRVANIFRMHSGVFMENIVLTSRGKKKLDSTKASGPDDIPNAVLKLCAHSVSKY